MDDIEAAAADVFTTLAKGGEAIGLEEFQRCATVLAQLSEDFITDSKDKFDRMDRNKDTLVQRSEFITEVNQICEVIGARKAMAALEQVLSVARQFESQAGGAPSSASRPLSAARRPLMSSRSAYPGTAACAAGGRLGDSFGNQGLGLNIKQKPLHPRGPRELGRAREKVVENMIEYFKGLRAQYEEKLAQMLRERVRLDGEEDADIEAPPPAIFANVSFRGKRRPGTPEEDDESEDDEDEFAAMEVEAQEARRARQAQSNAVEGAARRLAEEDQGEDDEADEGEEDEEDEEGDEESDSEEEEEEEEEDAEDGEDENDEDEDEEDEEASGKAQGAKAKASVEEGAKEVGAEGDAVEGEAPTSPPADSAEAGIADDATEVAAGDEDGGGQGAGAVAAAGGEDGADADRDVGGGASAAKADAAGAGKKKQKEKKDTKSKKEKKDKAKDSKPKSAKQRDARQPQDARRSPNLLPTGGRAGGRCVAGAVGGGGSRGPGTGGSRSAAGSPELGGEASGQQAVAPQAQARNRVAKLDVEGVSCLQELELGFAIRSALCNGGEVWCADWKGVVTVRERDDAMKVKAEIPTNRFVWCMAQMEPGLIWMGQEAQGISLFNVRKKEYKASLMGGHSGGVTCLALESSLGDEQSQEGVFPVRRGWSGSNDFTIRQWWIETWKASAPPPEQVKAPGSVVLEFGELKVGIFRGAQMHGHTNGVRALLKIGPMLWSGSDDGSIRLWWCAEGTCAEVLEDAHKGSVLKLAIVRSFVWSAGSDGMIKEWQIGVDGNSRCLRQVAPPGSEKGVYAIVPLGNDVWSCGHHPNIQVFSQSGMDKTAEHPAHEPYISNLLPVDRVESRIVWSTSLGDSKLRVWRHTVRGSAANLDELKAANRLFEEAERTRDDRMGKMAESLSQLQAQLDVAGDEYTGQLSNLAQQLAEEQAARSEAEALRQYLEGELDGLRRLFEEAGLAHLLQDPAALRDFLSIKGLFDEAGLGHLLQDLSALKDFLKVGQLFKEAGLEALLKDPEALAAFLKRATQLEEILRNLGLEDVLDDPQKLKDMLEKFLQLRQVLESYGMGSCVGDSASLAEVLSRYNGMKKAFEDHGFPELFEDPYTLAGFLRNYGRVREEFRNVDLEYLLDSAPAMREFLAANKQGAAELKELKAMIEKLSLTESLLDRTKSELAAMKAELEATKAELKGYKDLCPDLKTLDEWKDIAAQFKGLMKLKKAADQELAEAKRLLEEKEKERQEALERERLMALKYKELDIFKLDIIARELKKLDSELGFLAKPLKALQADAGKLRNWDEQHQIAPHGEKMLDQCRQLRAHIHDVINKCLSETQKMHIGVAVDDSHLAAGELKEGGVMAGYVMEEIEVPDHGNSKAAKLRQDDEMARERGGRA